MKTLLDYVPPADICRTASCGNAAQRASGFCADCVPLAQPQHLLRRILLLPVALLLRVLEV